MYPVTGDLHTGGPFHRIGRRAFKPVYILYYKVLFGRRFPGSSALARRVHAWELDTGRGDAPVSKETWETQYRAGGWDFMKSLDELARYSIITGYLHHLKPEGSLLDVGSGEGILRDEMRPLGYSRYVGGDLSQAAVEAGQAKPDPKASFVAADAEAYTPTEPFDAIVFNECLYYFKDPLATVARYKSFLEDGGLLIVSMFRSRRADVIAKRLEEAHKLLEEVAVTNRKGTWVVRIFR
jgi:2-polyprenyl-6-hydroxyphenyl methylase/3-demethylubiquinone-9 3-methyltransferase